MTKWPSYLLIPIILGSVFYSMDKSESGAQTALSSRRSPRFAGTWYDANVDSLSRQLNSFSAHAEAQMRVHPVEPSFPGVPSASDNILAIIVPHAGYAFSGETAAFAYEKLANKHFDRVFLLGPSHHVAFKGGALPKESVFGTPLGDLPVDRDQVKELSHFPYFREMPAVHDCEHSLEMQLPFIRKTLGEIKIVPIAIGTLSHEEDIHIIGSILARYIRKGDLVIISSDFTHYGPRFDYQPFKENIEDKIKQLDEEAFHCLEKPDLKAFLKFHDRTHDTICGFYPCTILLSILPAKVHGTLLKYRTSQEIMFDPDHNSVSYMSIVFSADNQNTGWTGKTPVTADEGKLEPADGEALLKIARMSLTNHLTNKPSNFDQILSEDQTKRFASHCGAFVTLFKKASKVPQSPRKDGKELRGCIGYIWPVKSMVDAVADNAISAATCDPRFQPVQIGELPNLQIEISILTPPHPVKSWQDIKLGKDGIIMHKNGKQAVFLPSVAPEFGWDLPQTLTQLSLKAGLGPDDWKDNALFDVFQAQSFEE